MVAEPRLAVLGIRIALESGVRRERGRGPFPDVAEHLPASPPTVVATERRDVDRVAGGESEVAGDRRAARRDLPLGLGGETASRPPAPRLGFMRVDMHHRPVRLRADRNPLIVDAALPSAIVAAPPPDRMSRA